MSLKRWLYRGGQFWFALSARPQSRQLDAIRGRLTTAQWALFARMQPSEQAHALQVLVRIQARCADPHPDLVTAALLHDVGKVRVPLRLWERVVIVLGKALFPDAAKSWGQRSPQGWARPFVVAARHPAWGAEMAARAGVSPLAQALIRRHQASPPVPPKSPEDRLLVLLQAADDES